MAADVDKAVRRAFLFAHPIDRMACTRQAAIDAAKARGTTVINNFAHRSRLATADDRAVTTPNNDTLYSAAWLDLRNGPVMLTLPSLPNRYHSVALMTMRTDNFAVLGTRGGGRGGRYLVVPPNWRGPTPASVTIVRSPGVFGWALARALVNGEADLSAAVSAQTGISLKAISLRKSSPIARLDCANDTPAGLLDRVNAVLGEGIIDDDSVSLVHRAKQEGISPGDRGAFAALPRRVKSGWLRDWPTLKAQVRAGLRSHASVHRGWLIPKANIGRFGPDDAHRAAVATGGLGALPIDEAVYLSRTGAGTACEAVTIPATLPLRTQGFWSLTLYDVAPDGSLFFHRNPEARYAIGDRSPGLVLQPDGSVAIDICPTRRSLSNWLPVPTGQWQLVLRVYRPAAPVYTLTPSAKR